MSNSNDPKSPYARTKTGTTFAGLAKDKTGEKAPVSPFVARIQQANAEPESAAAIFARKMAEHEAGSKKTISAGQAILDKVAKQATNPVVAPPSSSVATESAASISFKERMEALYKRQSEANANLVAANTAFKAKPALITKPGTTIPPPARKIAGIATAPVNSVSAPTQGAGVTRPVFSRTPADGATPAAARPSFLEKKAPIFSATRTGQAPSLASRTNTIVPTQAKGDFKITTDEFIEMRDFLYEQAGIFVPENRKYLMENRLSSRLRELGLRNFHEYHKYLKFDNNKKAELNKLFENMTTNETSFFRNNPQLDVFRDKVLARVIAEQRAKGQKKIHIWSAGCSSGEEPYTIGIIIHELLKNEVDSWDIKITANDLSLAVLETAKKGIYSEYALRTTPQEIIDKYFTKEGKMYKILPKVQKLVSFGQINLSSSEQLSKVERSQIVFCRNVIIYFDDEMKRHVISSFYDNLLPGGFLLIGHSESLHSISRTFVPEHFTGAIVYGKKS